MAGGDFTDTLTFWVALSTVPLWAIAIVLKRINARRRARKAAAAKQAKPADCFFSVSSEHPLDAPDHQLVTFRKLDGQ